MRDNVKIKNQADDKQNIYKPIIIVTSGFITIIGIYIFLGIKFPSVFGSIRDLIITLIAVSLFLINTAAAVLFFILASRIDDAKIKIDEAASAADGKVEELGDKITEVLIKILDPVFQSQSTIAGIMQVLKIFK